MSFTVNGTGNIRADYGSNLAFPFTMACYIKIDDFVLGTDYIMSGCAATSGTVQFCSITTSSSTDNRFQATTAGDSPDTTSNTGKTLASATEVDGVWFPLVAVFTSTNRTIYPGSVANIAGPAAHGDTFTATPRYFSLGSNYSSYASGILGASGDAKIAEFAVWNTDLDNGGTTLVNQYMTGTSASLISPANLVLYNPLRQSDFGSDTLQIGTFATSGTAPSFATGEHPTINYGGATGRMLLLGVG